MKKLFTIFVVAVLIVSCTKEYEISTLGDRGERDYLPKPTRTEVTETEEGLMELGPQLANPYALAVMQQARVQLLEANSDLSIPELSTSHYYVRFAPQNDEEMYSLLQDTTVYFYEYPLDRDIISGTYYHDPAIADTLPTYQYASIPKAKWESEYANSTISYQILEHLFIPEEAEDFFDDDDDDDDDGWIVDPNPDLGDGTIDPINPGPWIPAPTIPGEIGPNNYNNTSTTYTAQNIVDMLVNKSMVITGLETVEEQNRAQLAGANSSWNPSGRITAYDDIVGGPVPLVGVKVRARRWFTTSTATTDSNGNFVCLSSFKRPVNYCIIWESNKWDIRDGRTNQAYFNGPKQKTAWIQYIDGGKSLAYSAIHRALYRIYYKYSSGLVRPDYNKVNIQYFHSYNNNIYGSFPASPGNKPNVKIWGKDEEDKERVPSLNFSTVCHEVGGHGAHMQNCSSYTSLPLRYVEAWAMCIQYCMTCREYEELGVFDSLNVATADNQDKAPDFNYNFQRWNKAEYPNDDYIPIFVDVVDNYNQRQFEKENNTTNYPNDLVCYTNVAKFQNIVFNATDFSDVLSGFAGLFYNPNSNNSNMETLRNLIILFEFYGYEAPFDISELGGDN